MLLFIRIVRIDLSITQLCLCYVAPQNGEIFKQKNTDCVQHIILQKFTNFHSVSHSFQVVCSEAGCHHLFCVTLYVVKI